MDDVSTLLRPLVTRSCEEPLISKYEKPALVNVSLNENVTEKTPWGENVRKGKLEKYLVQNYRKVQETYS